LQLCRQNGLFISISKVIRYEALGYKNNKQFEIDLSSIFVLIYIMATSQDIFGSVGSTGKKLEIIREYLQMYQKTVGSLSFFQTHYVDAFAGTGEINTQKYNPLLFGGLLDDAYDFELADEIIIGSTEIALNIVPSFESYTFIEIDQNKISDLNERFQSHALYSKVKFSCGDANEQVKMFCKSMGKNDRAVVFLDPFGSQVEWTTIEAIAATRKIDLWYLFPSGVGVFRQISKDGKVHPTHKPSISRLYGTEGWQDAFIKRKPAPTLFDLHAMEDEKAVDPAVAADFMLDRMRSVFKGGVGEFKIPLGKHAYPSFHLLFAWGNPSKGATELARKLSRAAVTVTENNHGGTFGN